MSDELRERLGRRVREVWIKWAERQPNPKPSWLVPYDELPPEDQDADECIGMAIWADCVDSLQSELGELETLRAERDAAESTIRTLQDGVASRVYGVLYDEVRPNDLILVTVDKLVQRLAEAEAHEQQTHERLGVILGTDTSLEDAAKRMAKRLAAASDRVLECGHAARFTTNRFGGEKHGESYCMLCEIDALTARLAAAEAALARIALSETGNKCWSDFAQDFLGWKSTSELWDIIKAAKAGGGE